jgi:hypothetical protein
MLGKRTGSFVDVVGESRRVLAVLEPLQPRPRRVVDPLRHQISELCVAQQDRVSRPRAPADIFSEKRQVMSEHPLSVLMILRTESLFKPVSEN